MSLEPKVDASHPDASNLTPRQRQQLLALRGAGAVSPETGRRAPDLAEFGEGSTLVLGRLRDLGLVKSRVVRRGVLPMSGQWTEYWLTPAGETAAAELAGETSALPSDRPLQEPARV